jgi:hypothetical protein
MELNIGRADQLVRGILGAGLILLTGLGMVGGTARVIAVAIGSIAVFTASAGFCPIYRLLGRMSCEE